PWRQVSGPCRTLQRDLASDRRHPVRDREKLQDDPWRTRSLWSWPDRQDGDRGAQQDRCHPKIRARQETRLAGKSVRPQGPFDFRRQRRRRRRNPAGYCARSRQRPQEGPSPTRQATRVDAMSDPLKDCRRLVVKVGSALLVDAETGALRRDWLKSLCADIAALKREGCEVILVSSGAIALGRRALNLKPGALRLEESQAAAAAGQVRLAEAYADILAGENIVAAQILLTLGDTEERRRYLNARATMRTLLALGAVPVINEYDTVATTEIRYGDNDRLGARVASMVEADCLILLSDVDGLYEADPTRNPNAKHIPEVASITSEIETMAGESISGVGRGGMASKLIAAKIATGAGA